MKALVILDYNRGEVVIFQGVKGEDKNDWEAYIQGVLHYNIKNIEWMLLDICKDEPLPLIIRTL